MEGIKLSFIIPMFNSEKYLNLCFESLLNQDIPHDEYEIICINDGSTDKTKKICQDYKVKFPNFRYFEQTNKGVSCARNHGLIKATGKYIWFIDSDDEILERCLSRILFEIFDGDLDVLEIGAQRGKSFRNVKTKLNFSVSRRLISVYCSRKIVKREIIFRNAIFFSENLKYAEDHLWCLQLEKAVNKIEYCRNPIYLYRVNETSVTTSPNSRDLVLKSMLTLLCKTNIILTKKEKSEFQRTLVWIVFMSSYSINDKLKLITLFEKQGDYPYKYLFRDHFAGGFNSFNDLSIIKISKKCVHKLLYFIFRYKPVLILFFYIKEFSMKKISEVKPILDMEEIKRIYYGE